jgi:hypothetical protein
VLEHCVDENLLVADARHAEQEIGLNVVQIHVVKRAGHEFERRESKRSSNE